MAKFDIEKYGMVEVEYGRDEVMFVRSADLITPAMVIEYLKSMYNQTIRAFQEPGRNQVFAVIEHRSYPVE